MKARVRRAPAVLLLALATRAAAAQDPAAPSVAAELVLRFRAEAVDGVDVLVLRGREARIEHLEFRPIVGAEVEVLAAPAERPGTRYVVRNRVGRPRVSIVGSPGAQDGELRIRIDDGPAPGAAALSFEVWSVPGADVPRPHDVLLITIDSLRPDRLGAYGHARDTSPNLDRFARTAVRFDRAWSTSSFTPPAHASILTSRYVGDHGLKAWNPLREEELTLAELLEERGYRTGACVNLALLSEQNLGQGFGWRREGDRDARAVVDEALRFLAEDDGRPWFLWLHLYDVHRPYGRAPGAAARFAARARPGVGDREDHYNLRPEDVRDRGLSREDLDWIVDRYDAGIAYADAELGPLFSALSTPERLSKTLVVVSADHGENLLDHAERAFSHDPLLHASVTRVPLFVRYPGGEGAGTARSDPVSLIDLAPTVLDVLGVGPPRGFRGRSLAGPVEATPERPLHHECWGWSRLAATRTREWLLVRDVERGTTAVWSLVDDPGERNPLDPRDVPRVAELARDLEAFAARPGAVDGPPPVDAETLERLRRLGYVEDGR